VGCGAAVQLEGIGYGRIHWGNEEDILTDNNSYYRFLAGAAALTGARSALEIGTHWGGSARAIARGMKDGGKIVTIDVSSESDAVLPSCPERKMIQKIVGDANSLEVIEQVQSAISNVDMLYIDAEHSAMPSLVNLSVYLTLLHPKMVLLDDIALNESMARFWQIVRRAYPDRSINCAQVEPDIRPDGAAFGLIFP